MSDRTVVTDNIFLRLKKQDDKIKKQYLDIVKKSPQKQNPFHQDPDVVQSPFKDEDNSPKTGQNASFQKKGTKPKFSKEDTTISDINNFNESRP